MTLRLVQAGAGPARDVVIVYHLGAAADPDVAEAIGPGACILNETVPQTEIGTYTSLGPGGISTVAAAVGWAQGETGAFTPHKLLLAGFSAGSMALRTQLLAGIDPDAIVVADGIQSPRTDTTAWMAPWVHYVEEAAKGEHVLIASHSTQGQTNLYNTTETLRLVTGFALDKTGPPDAPVVSQEKALIVLSYSGNDHHAQGYAVLPKMLGLAMGFLSKSPSVPPPPPIVVKHLPTISPSG